MSKNHNAETPEMMESIGEAMSKTELYFEKNGKKISFGIFALFIVAALVFGYKSLVVEPKEQKGAEAISNAQLIFEQETPDYQAALEGNDLGMGFLEVIENYGSTTAGNLAAHYAGICYLQLGDFDNAATYLAKYKTADGLPAAIVNAQNLGLQGDIAVENGEFDKAEEFYAKAIKASDNILSAPMYMQKAAVVAIANGKNDKAKELFEAISAKYPNTIEGRNAAKYSGTIK